jgi:hypothetical protein
MSKKTIPFVALSVVHFILFFYTFIQKKQKTLPLFISSIGMAYVFEYFVLNLFKMYQYYPRVSRNKWIDSVFGALLSQAVFVPIAATFIALFNLGGKWQLGFTLFYGLTERIFIKWKIFKIYKWSTFFTICLLPLYFQIVKRWWELLQKHQSKFVEVLSVLFCYWVNYTNIYFFIVVCFRKFFLRIGFLKDTYWEHFILVPLYTLYLSIICTKATLAEKPISKWKTLITLHLSDLLLSKLNILKATKQGIRQFVPIHLGFLLLGDYVYKIIKRV